MTATFPSAATEPVSADAHDRGAGLRKFWLLTLGCIGVVYGDIGTSPLYSFREAALAAAGHGRAPGLAEIFGILSLIIWALIVVVTLKYVLLLLYADNRGEGGILTLTALARKALGHGAPVILFLGLTGAALFYGDAAITPAISVLSAVEGLELVAPSLTRWVLLISITILIGLFLVQKHGTEHVSLLFGPVMTLWMLMLAAMGVPHIVQTPRILLAVNPAYGVAFLAHHPAQALPVLGAVFLAVTGAEALYADLGHFGRKPIQFAWLSLVFPALLLNYFGQGALLLTTPAAIENPFFLMVPHILLLPLVIMATAATIIASQAVITGTYSLTRQAIQLGLLPRMDVQHTSEAQEGQIYMPKVNRLQMLAVIFLVLLFKSSSALASAYGIAVTGTMVTTSLLAFVVIRRNWRRSLPVAAALIAPLLAVETVFLAANMTKIFEGGIVPLLFAAFLILLMNIWVRGSRYVAARTKRQTMPLTDLIQMLEETKPQTAPGTAIFLTGDPQSAPFALLQNIRHNNVLHEHNVLLTVLTAGVPRVAEERRMIVQQLAPYMTCIVMNFGYSETPDVPRALARLPTLALDAKHVTYFLSRRTLIADSRRGLPEWQEFLYIPMARGAADATDYFGLPANKVVELGMQIAV